MGPTAHGLKFLLDSTARRALDVRQRSTSLETRRARDCARNVRPSRAANNDPHPRAPGALALSLMRARDLEKQGEGKRGVEPAEGELRKALKKGRAVQSVTLGGASCFVERIWLRRFLA